ncbi:MAG: ABC transporter ATP-binding protein [Actinomycetaceae bacterium]|nr:ABC transporter ATP-binding protein [Actinomycetaceae bacterium]
MLSTLKEFFDFCSPRERRQFYISVFVGVLKAMFTALRIPAIAIVVYAIINDSVSWRTAVYSLYVMGVSIVGMIFTQRSISMLQTEGGFRACAHKRIEIAEHMRYVPMGYFTDNSLGRITSIATNTLENLADVASRVVMLVLQGILTAALVTIAIFVMDIRIGGILCGGLFVFILLNMLLQRKSISASDNKHERDIELVEVVMEYVRGIAEVKNYSLATSSLTRLADKIHSKSAGDARLELDVIPFIIIQSLWLKLLGVGISLVSIWFYIDGSLSLFITIMMLLSAYMVYESLDAVSSYSSLLRSVHLAVEHVNDVLKIEKLSSAEYVKDMSADEFKPSISVENVDFSYGNTRVLHDVSLSVQAGQRIALVGPSGSGKTTLVRLMARFWDVESGSVKVSGKDVREWNFDDLMEKFSFVFQRVFLFEDTIANNIRFGVPEASEDDVIAAAKAAQCHDFIMSLPDGYDTVIGEGGARLSGGEKQRISIARAFLKDAPIIILDEATANVDPENERELVAAVENLTSGKTVIMIAHRLSTVKTADCIYVFDEGCLVDSGTHKELAEADGIYSRFLDMREKAQSWTL